MGTSNHSELQKESLEFFKIGKSVKKVLEDLQKKGLAGPDV